MLLCFQNCCQQQVQFRVGFGSKINTAHEQHVISSIWYISLSHDWLICFRFLTISYLEYSGFLGPRSDQKA